MKHTFKVGDGMTTQNSTAEERLEIFKMALENGYPTYSESVEIFIKGSNYKTKPIGFKNNKFMTVENETITNPLTYQQMKNYIQPTMNTTQAIELLKNRELQIEIEDNLFSIIMFSSRSKLLPYFDYEAVNNYAYFDGDFMRGRECALQDVRVIKLCDIVDDEPTEQHKTPFDFIMPRVEKAIARGLSDFNAIEAINSGLKHDIYATQQFKELTVKPIELEVGKWYKSSNYLICYVGNERCYGVELSSGDWIEEALHNEKAHKIGNYQPATPAEVTEALTKEAVKSGLIEGVYIKRNFNGLPECILVDNTTYPSDEQGYLYYDNDGVENFMELNGFVIYHNGKWATVAETISLKDAEKELGKKIIV